MILTHCAGNAREAAIKHIIIIISLTNQERGHQREISDRGLDVLTNGCRGQYIKAEVSDLPVMTERTR